MNPQYDYKMYAILYVDDEEQSLKYFRKEYIEHIHDKRCRSGVCEELTKSVEDRKKTEKPEEVHA